MSGTIEVETINPIEGVDEEPCVSENDAARGYRLSRLRAALQGRRIEARMTLKDVVQATKVPLSISQLSRIERGDIDSPSFIDVAGVGHVLGFTGNDLFSIVDIGRDEQQTDPRLRQVVREVMAMPEETREAFIQVLLSAVVGFRLGGQFDEQQ